MLCPHRLARPRTSPFQGGNTGSNPVGDVFYKVLKNKLNLQQIIISLAYPSLVVFVAVESYLSRFDLVVVANAGSDTTLSLFLNAFFVLQKISICDQFVTFRVLYA